MNAKEIIEKYKEISGKDLSQREIADTLGWSAGTLSGVLNGSYPKTKAKEREMAKALLGIEDDGGRGQFVPITIKDVTIATKDFTAVYELCNSLLSPESSLTA